MKSSNQTNEQIRISNSSQINLNNGLEHCYVFLGICLIILIYLVFILIIFIYFKRHYDSIECDDSFLSMSCISTDVENGKDETKLYSRHYLSC